MNALPLLMFGIVRQNIARKSGREPRVDLVRVVPEALKPRKIEIGTASAASPKVIGGERAA